MPGPRDEREAMMERVRVLIADDSPHARQGLRAVLAMRAEVEVVGQASNGQEAVQQVQECRPDVVLMDVRMPVMDGLEAMRLIKDKWPHVKIIALSMYATYRAEALAAGADSFLVKGWDSCEELLQAIQSHMGGERC